MSSPKEKEMEERSARRARALGHALDGGLVRAVERAGAEVEGFAIRIRGYDCLLIIRGVLAGRKQVCFVGASDPAGCFLKAVDEAQRDKLRWQDDKFAKDGD